MNLYIFNETRRGTVYGVGTYIRELTVALKDSNINICVVNLTSDKPHIQTNEMDGVRHWYFPAPILELRTIDNQKIREIYYRNVVYLLQLYIQDKMDLIFHLNYIECKPLADALRIVFDCKIVFVIHYLHSVMNLLGHINLLRRIISQTNELTDKDKKSAKELFLKEKELSHTMDKIICLSNHTFDLLHQDYQIGKEKMVVLCNGLIDSYFFKKKQTLRLKYHIPDIPIILFVGRVDSIKGLTYALRAFKTVLNTLPHCRFIIAGNGTFDFHLIECEDIWMNVTWTGLIEKDKLYDLYSIADIGVMPSFHEQCSYVAIEMMMHGLPIIGSTTTGLKEMIEDNETGLHIPVIEYDKSVEIDTSLLAEKILYLLQHPMKAKQLGKNSRKRFLKHYSSEVFCRNMLDFYHSLYEKDV